MQENRRTDDFGMQVIHVNDLLLHKIFGEQPPTLFTHRMNDVSLTLDTPSFTHLLSMLDNLWQSVHTDFEDSRNHLLAAILCLLTSLSQHNVQRDSRQPRNVAVFNRFITLVSGHCDRQRTLDFYADRLCLSKQYLGSIIVEVSRRTAREWIDEAALQRIKVMLQHSTVPLNDISERMSFVEPSHFSRYFKRLTGKTPREYRNGK